MALIAKAGDAIATEDGKVICYAKNDIHTEDYAKSGDFHRFADDETPWIHGDLFDKRVTRLNPAVVGSTTTMQLCVNGEWMP